MVNGAGVGFCGLRCMVASSEEASRAEMKSVLDSGGVGARRSTSPMRKRPPP